WRVAGHLGRVEVLELLVANVGLGIHLAGRGLVRYAGRSRYGPAGMSCLKKLADQLPHGRVVALAEVHGPDVALCVDQVVGRPVLIAVGVPRRVVVADMGCVLAWQARSRTPTVRAAAPAA